MPSLRHLLLSGYIAAPEDPAEEDEFFAGLVGLGIGGLEHALPLEGTRSLEPAWVGAEPAARVGRRRLAGADDDAPPRRAPTYGLGSLDEDQRAHALADVARARDLAVTLAQADGRRRVSAIEVHSAPGPRGGSVEAFSRSLDEILGWDLAGAELLVEHCDAYVPGPTPAKGFWTLEDELAVVRSKGLPADVLGMCVNWGRSVIEGRSTATAVEHTQAVAEAGLLRDARALRRHRGRDRPGTRRGRTCTSRRAPTTTPRSPPPRTRSWARPRSPRPSRSPATSRGSA